MRTTTGTNTKINMKSITEIINELEDEHDLAPNDSHLRVGQAYIVEGKPMVLTDITYGRHSFTDGCYGFGRTLGRRESDNKILDNLKIAEGVNPQTILDKLSDSVQSMVEFYQGRRK